MQNKLAYNQAEFESQFIGTAVHQQLVRDYDIISFDKFFVPIQNKMTPRQSNAMFDAAKFRSKFSAVPFYYLKFLLDRDPETIYDLGCGWNIFKRYIPRVIGIGAEHPNSDLFYGDLHGRVDDVFVSDHQDWFESVFSINSMHYVPLASLGSRLLDFHSMIRPGGRGFIALNLMRMLQADPQAFLGWSTLDLENHVRESIQSTAIDFVVIDVDFFVLDDWMDGNIRLVMQRP